MALINPPRCPQCNADVSLVELWRVAPKQSRGTLFDGPVGIMCPACGVKLRVLQARVQVSFFLPFVVTIALAVLVGRIIPLNNGTAIAKVAITVLGFVYFGGFVLQQRYIPALLQLRYLRVGEEVQFPLVERAKQLAEQQEAEERDAREQSELESPDVGQPVWKCLGCGEENPGNFEECWNCQKEKGG